MKKILFLLLIIALFIPLVSAVGYLSSYDGNRVLLMHFNGDNGGITLTDENGKTITNNGVIIKTNTNDWGGAAGYFSSDYATTPDSANFNYGNSPFTILAWVNQTTTGSTATLFCQANSGGDNYASCIHIISGVPNFEDKSYASKGAVTSPSITTSGKHQLVVSRNITHIMMYTDGVMGTPRFVGTNSTYDATTVFTFGQYGDYAGEYLVGNLDEVAIWKGTAIPISELWPQSSEVGYDAGDSTPPDSITGLTNTTALCDEITWQWMNPTSTDYAYLYTQKNNVWTGNYSNSTSAATWTGLTALTNYTFSSKTVDLSLNMNATWVNRTAQSPSCPATPTPTPTPAPTALPGTQWCGLQSLYFNHGYAILPAGYESLNVTPPGLPEIDELVTVKASTSPILIDSYISPQGYPGVNSIAAGTRTYNIYGYVNGAAGITRFNVTLHTRDITGLETFHYQAYSDDVNDLSTANQQFSFSHPQINMATTDRLVIRVYADTDAASDKILHFVYQGTTHSSRVDSAYFNCIPATTATTIPPWQPVINPPTDYKTDPWTLIKDWWFVPVTIAAFMVIFGGRR